MLVRDARGAGASPGKLRRAVKQIQSSPPLRVVAGCMWLLPIRIDRFWNLTGMFLSLGTEVGEGALKIVKGFIWWLLIAICKALTERKFSCRATFSPRHEQ